MVLLTGEVGIDEIGCGEARIPGLTNEAATEYVFWREASQDLVVNYIVRQRHGFRVPNLVIVVMLQLLILLVDAGELGAASASFSLSLMKTWLCCLCFHGFEIQFQYTKTTLLDSTVYSSSHFGARNFQF